MEWISIQERLPDNGKLILVLCSLEFCEENVAMGRFRKSKRNRYPDRVVINGNFGHYSTILSIDSIQ